MAAVNHDIAAIANASDEATRLRRENEQLSAEVRVLELKVQKLQRMLWDRKSERMAGDDKQGVLFNEPAGAKPEAAPAVAQPPTKQSSGTPRAPRGPKPLDPALPREVIQVPAPELKALICPVTKQPMTPGFVEHKGGHRHSGENHRYEDRCSSDRRRRPELQSCVCP